MAITRLDSDERRKAIVEAAVPLFARKGFAGTTTRELAEAAGISEALLFRHFPSKQSLYQEILQRSAARATRRSNSSRRLPASTETLVGMVRFMVRHFVLGSEASAHDLDRRAADLHSFLEDGDYARELFDGVSDAGHAAFRRLARGGGSRPAIVVPRPASGANRFWFAHHVAAMIAFAGLPGRRTSLIAASLEALVEEASGFILRGIGMTDAAIAATRCGAALQSAAD